jgi:hypothetical protein
MLREASERQDITKDRQVPNFFQRSELTLALTGEALKDYVLLCYVLWQDT